MTTTDTPTAPLFAATGRIEEYLDAYDLNPGAPLHVATQRGNYTGLDSDRHLEATDLRIVVEHIRSVMKPEVDRADLIDALSWAENLGRGRWGAEYATAVLAAHDARVHAKLLAENAELKAYASTAHGEESWSSAMAEIQRLRDELADRSAAYSGPPVADPDTDDSSTRASGAVVAQHNWAVANSHRSGRSFF